ncbi:MAG: DMT family transporter [Candidatus Neomarinimicrobiota bacterium]|nr:MAG: DMT family transporter [Candidatus Neomarinimicrobiota bacterium]
MNKTVLYLLLASAMLTWGLSWTNGHILAGYEISVWHLIFWRFFLASVLFTPVVFITGYWRIHRSGGLWGALAGGFLIGAYNLFFFLGSRLGLAGAGGVLVTTLNPIITSLLAAWWFGRSLRRKDILGLILGLTGGAIILNIWDLSWDSLFQSGNFYFLLCAFTWAVLTVLMESVRDSIHVLTFSLITYWVAGLIALPFSVRHGLTTVFHLDGYFWLNLAFVSAGAMAFGTTVYFLATKSLGSEKSSSFIFLVPASALIFAAWILREPFQFTTVGGGFLAASAIYLINRN